MRETVILSEKVTALSQLIVDPPLPSYIGKTIPLTLSQKLTFSHYNSSKPHVIIFLSEGCNSCQSLTTQLKSAVDKKLISKNDISCVIEAHETSSIVRLAQSISQNVVCDQHGDLFKVCEVRGTPAQMVIYADSLKAYDYLLGGNLEWIIRKLPQRLEMVSQLPLEK